MENQKTISAWSQETFGDAGSNAVVAARARREMAELLRALTHDDNSQLAASEIADTVIVLYRLADRMGFDMHAEIDRKMAVNRTRRWEVGSDGIGYHVRKKTARAPEQITETSLKQLIRDPRYWKYQDPEIVERVRDGFRKLYQSDDGDARKSLLGE